MKRISFILMLLTFVLSLSVQAQTECEEGFRLFDHEFLATEPVCIPEDPQRVVDLIDLETMVLLEMVPVATWELPPFVSDYPDYAWLADEDIVELTWPPSVEAILGTEPDLILSATYMEEANNDFAAIAPTVIFDWQHSGQWKNLVNFIGAALNRSDEVEILMNTYNQRIENFREAFSQNYETPIEEFEVSVVRVYPDQINLYTAGGFPGIVISDIGFARPESQAYDAEESQAQFGNFIQYTVSQEELPRVDGDAVFVVVAGTAETRAGSLEALAALRNDPLWSTLRVVEEGRVYEVGGYWIGSTLLAAHAMLDDLESSLLPE